MYENISGRLCALSICFVVVVASGCVSKECRSFCEAECLETFRCFEAESDDDVMSEEELDECLGDCLESLDYTENRRGEEGLPPLSCAENQEMLEAMTCEELEAERDPQRPSDGDYDGPVRDDGAK